MRQIKLVMSLYLIMMTALALAQNVPQAINFQAIARDANNEVLANTDIMIQLTILEGSADGPQVYREIRSLTTNAYGSFSFQIGREPYMANGVFSEIDWAGGHKFLKIDYDPTATLSFNLSLGTIEFVTVPYAFAAGSVTFIDATGANDGDVLTYNAETGRFEPQTISVPDWAMQPTKPTYDYSEIENTPDLSTFMTETNYNVLAIILQNNNSANGNTITDLANPTSANDAVNKAYLDSVVNALKQTIEFYGGTTALGNPNLNGQHNGHEYVDLGLPSGTLWATCNVGANSPEEYGNIFAWGETEPKDVYDQNTYKYYENGTYTKYNSTDSLTTLEAIDDAATVNWGDGWRTPTPEEFQELFDSTYRKTVFKNGILGLQLTGKNGNTIFIPCDVWTSYNRITDHNAQQIRPYKVKDMLVFTNGGYQGIGYNYNGFNADNVLVVWELVYNGKPVRPVYKP